MSDPQWLQEFQALHFILGLVRIFPWVLEGGFGVLESWRCLSTSLPVHREPCLVFIGLIPTLLRLPASQLSAEVDSLSLFSSLSKKTQLISKKKNRGKVWEMLSRSLVCFEFPAALAFLTEMQNVFTGTR